jgi:hypothetical protein
MELKRWQVALIASASMLLGAGLLQATVWWVWRRHERRFRYPPSPAGPIDQ